MSTRRRILMLTTQLGYGGAETSFIRLANLLAESMEVTVALFTRDYGMDAYAKGHEVLNATIVLLDKAGNGRLQRWWRRIGTVSSLKRQHDVTISFLSGPNLVNVLAGRNARTVVSLRGSRVYDPLAAKRQRWLFRHVLDPIIFRLAARIVPVSEGLRHEIGAHAQAKVRAIPPFVALEALQHKAREQVDGTYAALRGQPVIVGAGRLSIEKGFHHLIRVVAALAKTQPGVKLLLLGDGPMLPQLRAQCEALGLAMDNTSPGTSAVLFAGYQKNILPLMALARVFVLASATEGFPSVLLEAMLAGVPVVAADTPWGARAILDGAPSAQPYPTLSPAMTRYGTLMPRIDQAEYEAAWVNTLTQYLAGTHALAAQASTRPTDFDRKAVGEQWKQLIDELCHE